MFSICTCDTHCKDEATHWIPAVRAAGRATSGISLYKAGATSVDYLEVRRVNASNFGQNGITLNRAAGAGYMRNVVITDTLTFSNPGDL